jgi:hypothetical protein
MKSMNAKERVKAKVIIIWIVLCIEITLFKTQPNGWALSCGTANSQLAPNETSLR